MSQPTRYVESVVTMYQNSGHPIKMLKMDHQFNTVEILAYLDSMHSCNQFSPPNEHEYIGRIERNNRTTQDKLSCALAISSAKSKKYGYTHQVMLSLNSMLFPVNIYHDKRLILSGLGLNMISTINHYYPSVAGL